MKSSYALVSAAMAAMATLALAAPADVEKRATPKVILAGDSTMAKGGGGSGTEGKPSTLCYPQPQPKPTY